ncbi:uncharacterized protein [Antedon mediterranea]|uniref:uncharacterized protein n=1 Tax=Antedon mediterranea TaxID=105859 RepID=UPI003AF74EBF
MFFSKCFQTFSLCLCLQFGSSDPLDITVYSNTPLTSPSITNNKGNLVINSLFRGYALQDDKDIRDLSVGILYKNIDGKDNVTWADTDDIIYTKQQQKDMPDGKIFDTNSIIQYRKFGTHTYLGVANLQSQIERVGVFSFKAKKDEVVTNSAIVLTSAFASIEMEYRTITVGIGESVTINLSKGGGDLNDLRWRHNYGDEIHNLRGNTSAVIENIRRKDDGVYECYTGDRPDGNHGIMRLIVRACPSPKWNPPDCEMDCPVCYNGGVCDDKTGVCICPPGFKGESCLNGCGNNTWGRDCLSICSSTFGNTCFGVLLCPPDPVGCSCIDGLRGNQCRKQCEPDFYGADCRQQCHCDNCDSFKGCTSGSTCLDGYTGEGCLVPTLCPSGFFGILCNYPCHCKDKEDCNRDGSCNNGCHEAWAGPNCSIALPYHFEPPTIVNQTAATLTFDVTWNPDEDYGTGMITKRKLWYKSSDMNKWSSLPNTNKLNLFVNAKIQFRSQFFRMVKGDQTFGPKSKIGSIQLVCLKPLVEPKIEIQTIKENKVILNVKSVSKDPEQIQCTSILRYQVQYSDGNKQNIVNTTSSSQLEVELSGLSSCNAYVVNARVINNMDIAGNWGENLMVQTVPSKPTIESNPFANETHLLMKWNAAMCEVPNHNVTYHYELSGGVFQQGTTTETEVLFDDGIESCIEYTFTVLASYSNFKGISDTTTVMLGTNCDSGGQGTPIGVIIVCLVLLLVILILLLIVIKR